MARQMVRNCRLVEIVLGCLMAGASLVGCVNTTPGNGKQLCADPPSDPCASGFFCASDGHCWRNGTGPSVDPDDPMNPGSDASMQQPSDAGAPPVDAFVPHVAVPAPSGRAIVAGGKRMRSQNFRAVITAGQAPGGNRVMKSTNYKFIGGLVGSTGSAQEVKK